MIVPSLKLHLGLNNKIESYTQDKNKSELIVSISFKQLEDTLGTRSTLHFILISITGPTQEQTEPKLIKHTIIVLKCVI